jgi:hypothetical protein
MPKKGPPEPPDPPEPEPFAFSSDPPTFGLVRHWLPVWPIALKRSVPLALEIERYVNSSLKAEVSHESLLELQRVLSNRLGLTYLEIDRLLIEDAVEALRDFKVKDAIPTTPPTRITLSQAAGMVHREKRTLEYYKTNGTLPEPAVEGGGGKPNLYDWKVMRLWLIKTFGINLPEQYPGK